MELISPNTKLPEIEEVVLKRWHDDKIFQKQNEQHANDPEFSFFDGPPFANGLPHYGHLLTNTLKDVVNRYWVMQGYQVDRRFGWDCHGLPVEYEIEKREGLKGRADILELGIDRFNEMCRSSVQHYTSEWQRVITRIGRWVDWDRQYRTMDRDFMQSVWWVFKELYTKGLVYEGKKVVAYSPRTGSVVSNFEANQNYRDVQDPSVIVKFSSDCGTKQYLVWTTTPWTLPSNLAIAVNPDISMVEVREPESGELWVLAKSRLEFVFDKKNSDVVIEKEFPASELVGLRYQPLFSYFATTPNAFQILAGDFVSEENGTGIVHQAPAYGEDDHSLCEKNKIELVDPIDGTGCFTSAVPEWQGTYFKEADKSILKNLKDQNRVVWHKSLVHSYPFDERTDTPLMYKAIPSWYVAVEKISDQLVANNKKINWVPNHIRDGRMGQWLEDARDWAVSRNRFWGTPLPVWRCNEDSSHLLVVGSIAELEAASGQKVHDLHKPYVSEIKAPCQQCHGTMTQIELVFDCWFESGSMPYAQLEYPLKNQERFEKIFPADFIAEGLDQTRGWFYTLSVLSTALFNQPAFKNVIVNGLVLAESGKKMSKRARNYTPPEELLDEYGADSTRMYLLNSKLLKAENSVFSNRGVLEVSRSILLPVLNAYSFLATYADADGWQAESDTREPDHELDLWILSRLQTLKKLVTSAMKDYELYRVVPAIGFFIDELTNWYIRLSRRRFWGNGNNLISDEQRKAFTALHQVIHELTIILSPFAPFTSDFIYRALHHGTSNNTQSVHLELFPEINEKAVDLTLETTLAVIRNVIVQGRALRQTHKMRTRQVLASATVVVADTQTRELVKHRSELITSELNVKQLIFEENERNYVDINLKPNFKVLGKKLGSKLGEFKKHLAGINQDTSQVWDLVHKLETSGPQELCGVSIGMEGFLIERRPRGDMVVSSNEGITVLLDTKLTDSLRAEGFARELVNRIQTLRKDSGLEVSDRISLEIGVSNGTAETLKDNLEFIGAETLATSVTITTPQGCSLRFAQQYTIDETSCVVALEKT